MKHSFHHVLMLLLLLGCAQPSDDPSADDQPSAAAEPVVNDLEGNDPNAEIYRFLLSNLEKPPAARIDFITTTPMEQWGESGDWATIPTDNLDSIPHGSLYRPANEAYLKDGRVLEKGTDSEAWMHWISVKRWINDNEVEVEEGVWCCPLGGGASTTIYEKIDGKWGIKGFGESWVS